MNTILNSLNNIFSSSTAQNILISIVCILFVTLLVLLIRRFINPRVLKTGTPARAIIQDLKRLHIRLNDVWIYRISVKVYPNGSPPFEARFRRPIPPEETIYVQPGKTITVKYNPDRPQRDIAIYGYGDVTNDSTGLLDIDSQKELLALLENQQKEMKRLNNEGLLATAIVIALKDLNHRVNNHGAVCELRVKVIGKDGTTYDAELLSVIHINRLERYAPGAEIPVRCDPSDPKKIAIDSSRTHFSNPGEDPLHGKH